MHGPDAFDYTIAAACFAVAVLSTIAAFALEVFGQTARGRRRLRRSRKRSTQ